MYVLTELLGHHSYLGQAPETRALERKLQKSPCDQMIRLWPEVCRLCCGTKAMILEVGNRIWKPRQYARQNLNTGPALTDYEMRNSTPSRKD